MDDIDETMTTSTSSTPSNPNDTQPTDEGFEEDNHLYTEDRTRALTPANDHLNASAPGELSPPRSQPQPRLLPDPTPTETMANGTATRSSARLAKDGSKSGAADTTAFPALANDKDAANKPGGGWNNKKAQEDMQRAWDNVVDKDFSLKEYGDVILQGKAQMGGP